MKGIGLGRMCRVRFFDRGEAQLLHCQSNAYYSCVEGCFAVIVISKRIFLDVHQQSELICVAS
jgi:hypothetical protein